MDKELELTLKSYEVELLEDWWAQAVEDAIAQDLKDDELTVAVNAIMHYRSCALKTHWAYQ